MTLRMQSRATRWGEFAEVDLAAIGAGEFKLAVSYSHAARLTWSCLVAQHTAPIPAGVYIRVWIEGANDPSGDPFSAENPLFEGYVEQPEPSQESIGVNYTAHDPSMRATRKVAIFSQPWPNGTVPDEPPIPPTGGVPRLVYNVRITNDPDWSIQVGGDGTLGQIIAGILEYCYHPLVWSDAAPGDGTEEGIEAPYIQEEIDALTVKPQEKLDFAAESPRSAFERLQRYDPRMRFWWEPGTRVWRFADITQAPVTTITLNTRATAHPPLTLRLVPSTENCVTAVSIYGPPAPYTVDLRWDDPIDPYGLDIAYPDPATELTPLGDPQVFETFSTVHGMFLSRCWRRWQVTDPTKRNAARELPSPYAYQNSALLPNVTLYPIVLISYDRGTTWIEWPATFNTNTGIVEFTRPPFFSLKKESGDPWIPGSSQVYFTPNAMRLIWAPYGEPLKVRRPATGYEGTAYTGSGLEIEDFQNDEALMVGREDGQPVTTTERRAAFETYAQTLLDQRKDVVWTGGGQHDGLDWRFCRLNRRVRIAAEDGSGNSIETGWESIDAYVTDAEYDLEEQTTSLTYSADRLALFGIDPAQLKEQLGIRQLLQMVEYQTRFLYQMQALPNGKQANVVVGIETTPVTHYVDPVTNPQAAAQYQAYQQSMQGTGEVLPINEALTMWGAANAPH